MIIIECFEGRSRLRKQKPEKEIPTRRLSITQLSRGNMKKIRGSIFATLLLIAFHAGAAPVVSIGTYTATPNIQRSINISVTDAGSAAAEDIEGMTFTLQIANGSGTAPKIQSINLTSGTIWSGLVSPGNVTLSAGSTNQFKSYSLLTDNAGQFVNANGLLATAIIDTTNAAVGSYSLLLTGTLDPGSDSRFVNGLGNPVTATYNLGTLNITPLPSATTYTLAATAGSAKLHVGGSTAIIATLTNTGGSTADTITYAGLTVTNSGSLTSSTLPKSGGPVANSNGTDAGSGTFAPTSGGSTTFTPSVTSATNTVLNTSAGSPTSATPVTVEAYNLAAVNAITNVVNLGTVHKGGTFATSALSISNTAPANATYTEMLSAGGSVSGAASVTGSITGLIGGATNSTSIVVGLGGSANTGTAGNVTGTVAVALNSNAVNSSGLGTTALTTQNITVNGNVYSGLAVWNTNAGGAWGTLASNFGVNWSANAGSPGLDAGYSGVDTATFDNTVLTPGSSATVTLSGANPSLKQITFNTSGGGYTLAPTGGGAITLNASTGTASITASGSGSHAIGAPITLASNTNVTVSNTAGLNLSGGVTNNATLKVEGAASATAISGSGSTNIGTVSGNGSLTSNRIQQTSLMIGNSTTPATATVTLNASNPSAYVLPGDTTVPTGSSSGTSVLTSLSIANNGAGAYYGTLDLKNNNLVINYTTTTSPIDGIRQAILSAYNNGNWNGTGLTSSTILQDTSNFALGFGENNDSSNALRFNNAGTLFEGTPVNATSVLVKFTWKDDLTLDGVVDSSDAIVFGTNYDNGATTGHSFAQGDLNYDGVIDSSDAIIFGTAYNTSLAQLPEPSSFVLAALGAFMLAIAWRRRYARSMRRRALWNCSVLEIGCQTQ